MMLPIDIVSKVGAKHFLLVNPIGDSIEHRVRQTIWSFRLKCHSSLISLISNSNYRINSAQICPKQECISLKMIMFLDISCKLLTLSVILGHEVCEIVRNPDVLCLLTNRWLVLEGKENQMH